MHNKQVTRYWLRWLGLIGVIGLTACSSMNSSTTVQQATSLSPATMAQPANTALPTQPATRSTVAAPTPLKLTSTPTAPAQIPPPTPACGSDLKATPAQTEGPYYKPDTPERSSLIVTGTTGTKLIVTGYVLTIDCKPIAGAGLDFWQADEAGQYDNAGYTLRGHQTTDESGRYYLETVVPGLYPGRTRHIHVKVQAPNGPILTTQLYFPNEPGNNSDSIFNPALIADVQDTATGKLATFNFVLNAP